MESSAVNALAELTFGNNKTQDCGRRHRETTVTIPQATTHASGSAIASATAVVAARMHIARSELIF